MSGSGEAFLRVLTQNAHSSKFQEQESPVFSASTKEVLFEQKSRKACQKKKALISNFFSADIPIKEPQRFDSSLWQFCLKGPEDLQLLVSKSNIKQIAKKEIAYSRPSIELCTILQTLQKVDSLLKWR